MEPMLAETLKFTLWLGLASSHLSQALLFSKMYSSSRRVSWKDLE